MRRLTVILCSVTFLSVPTAAQTLIGKQIRFERTYPSASQVFVSSVVTVDNTVEVNCPSPGSAGPGCGDNINQGGYSVDIQADKILFRTAASGSGKYGSGSCNCFRFTLLNPGTLYFAGVSIGGTNIPNFGSGNVSFTDTTIVFNVAGLPAPASASLDLDIQLGTKGPLTVNPASLAFTASKNGPMRTLYLAVGENQVGRSFTTTITPANQWLKVTAGESTTPSELRLVTDPANVPEGSYTGKIDITPAGGNSTPVSVPITFKVGPQEGFHLQVMNSGVIYTENGTGTTHLLLTNSGSGSKVIHFLWDKKSVDFTSIVNYSPTQVTIDPNSSADLTLTAQGAAQIRKSGTLVAFDSQNILLGNLPVSIEPSPGRTRLGADQTALQFSALADPTDVPNPVHVPLNKTLLLKTSGPDIVTFSVGADSNGGHWLTADPAVGMTGALATVIVSANAGGLKPGGYQGKIDISYNSTFDAPSPAASHRILTIPVFLNVAPAGSAVPAEIEFNGPTPLVLSPSQPPDQSPTIDLVTVSRVPVTFNLADNYKGSPAFFMHSPDSVTGAAADSLTVKISIRPGVPLNQGIYHGELVVTGGGPADTPRRLQVVGVIPPGFHALSTAKPRAVDACTPTQIGVAAGSPLFNFTTQAGSPVLLDIGTADDCGNLGAASEVLVSFSNGDPAVRLLETDTGRWRGTWSPSNALAPVVATVTAYPTLDNLAPATVDLQGSVAANPKAVILYDGAVLNGASLQRDAPLAPGSFVSLFGSNLASGTELASVLPLGESLKDASATINGRPMPVHFASAGQVNAILPYDLPSGELTVVAQNGTGSSVARKVHVVQVAPGVFQYGENRGVVIGVHADGSEALTDSAHPAHAGETVVIYCTGLGEVDTSVPAGTQAPPKLVHTINTITATIGGKAAKVDYAGLSPGSTGLYQVNAVVPAGVAVGDSVELVLSGGGNSSAGVLMAVR